MEMTAVILTTVLLQTGAADPNRFNGFLILGYAIMWLIGVGYVISLVSRQNNLRKDIKLMRQLLQEDENEPQS